MFVRRGSGGDDSPEPPAVPFDEPPVLGEPERDAGTIGLVITGDTPATRGDAPGIDLPRRREKHEVRVLEPGGALYLAAGGARGFWVFLPFAHPEPDRVSEFYAEIESELGLTRPGPYSDLRKLKEVLADKTKRRRLGELYKIIRNDRNLGSLSLYAGPATRTDGFLMVGCEEWNDHQYRWRRPPWARRYRWPERIEEAERPERPAWLGTGDAKLLVRRRCKAFEDYFVRQLNTIGTFQLPHHGSSHNFAAELVPMLRPRFWIAAAGATNKYGHPDEQLVSRLASRGLVLRVSEAPSERFSEFLELEPL